MYHSIKNTSKVKKLKLPKGWKLSGDPSFLELSKSNFDTYFTMINTRIERSQIATAGLIDQKTEYEWRLDERSKNSNSLKIELSNNLTETQCKKLAIKHARNINRSTIFKTLFWILVGVFLTIIGSQITKLYQIYLPLKIKYCIINHHTNISSKNKLSQTPQ